MKKIDLSKFAGDVIKGDVTKTIVGGYGDESYQTTTTSCTSTHTGGWDLSTSDTTGDTNTDGDAYSSC